MERKLGCKESWAAQPTCPPADTRARRSLHNAATMLLLCHPVELVVWTRNTNLIMSLAATFDCDTVKVSVWEFSSLHLWLWAKWSNNCWVNDTFDSYSSCPYFHYRYGSWMSFHLKLGIVSTIGFTFMCFCCFSIYFLCFFILFEQPPQVAGKVPMNKVYYYYY